MENPEPDSRKRALICPEVRLVALSVLLASLWLIGSDALLDWTLAESSPPVLLGTLKDANFVITAGALLYFVLRRAYRGWCESEELRLAALRSARECYRKLSSRTQSLREEERTRISREIHDELGQLLTGVKMQLRLIENRLNDREDRSLNPLIDDLVEASATIDETIASVRRIASGLRPLTLDQLGLAAALGEEAEQFSRRTGIECQLTVGGMEVPICSEIETAAFRIFQESLTNVARHAQAHRIDAGCAIRDGNLTLSVRDDGVGIDSEVVENPASLGLIGMLERASDAGGKVEIKPLPGQGTEVVLTIPLPEETGPSSAPIQ